jgi:hypothetical protein
VELPKAVGLTAPQNATYGRVQTGFSGVRFPGDQLQLWQKYGMDDYVPVRNAALYSLERASFMARAPLRTVFEDDGTVVAPASTTNPKAHISGTSIVVADAANSTRVRLAQPSLSIRPRSNDTARFVVRVPGGAQGVVDVRVRTGSGATVVAGPLGNGQLFSATGPAKASSYRAEVTIGGAQSNRSSTVSLDD